MGVLLNLDANSSNVGESVGQLLLASCSKCNLRPVGQHHQPVPGWCEGWEPRLKVAIGSAQGVPANATAGESQRQDTLPDCDFQEFRDWVGVRGAYHA